VNTHTGIVDDITLLTAGEPGSSGAPANWLTCVLSVSLSSGLLVSYVA
jgi:hypothetical protein